MKREFQSTCNNYKFDSWAFTKMMAFGIFILHVSLRRYFEQYEGRWRSIQSSFSNGYKS